MTDAMMERLGFSALATFTSVSEFERHLELLLGAGVYVFDDGGDRVLLFGRALVDRVNGMRIYIYARDHAPPHFHVVGPDIDAAFRIDSGAYLHGNADSRTRSLIAFWFEKSGTRLVEVWNSTRPSDCQAGPIQDR